MIDSLRRVPSPHIVRLGLALCLAALAFDGSCLVGVSAGAEPPPTTLSATTGPATVDGHEATLTATVNDDGIAATYSFEWDWMRVSEPLEEVFSPNSPGSYGTTPHQAVPGISEPQQVSAVIEPPVQYAEYAYRVVLETGNGSEQVFGQPRPFSMPWVKDSPIEEQEVDAKLGLEDQPNPAPAPGSSPPPVPPPPTPLTSRCRVPVLTALTLTRARRLIQGAHCATLKIVGKHAAASSTVVSQSPRARTMIFSTARITVWLRSSKRAHPR